MEHLMAFLATAIAAFALGTVVADWRHRQRLYRDLVGAKAELAQTAARLADTHNSLGQQLLALQDRLAAAEMRQGTTQAPKRSWASAASQAADLARP